MTHYEKYRENAHALECDTLPQDGLSDSDVLQNQAKHGLNSLPEKQRKHVLLRFAEHLNDVLIYILIGAACVSLALGKYVDSVVILLVVLLNAGIGFFQENKAEKAIADLKKMLSSKAQVLRNGQRVEIESSELTIGDVVFLSPGGRVPADLRLFRVDNLKIDESPLTGESVPSEKSTAALPLETMLGDRKNMAFSSTAVSAGTGAGIVIAIGADTEIGKINQMLSDVVKIETPLLKQTAEFGKLISAVIVLLALGMFFFGTFFRDMPTGELLMAVIALAVAAIPEGLPATLSIILAVGVQNMAKRKATIRNLPSVETLGAVSVICSDKTGTLTKNEMTVKQIVSESDDELIKCFKFCNDAAISHGNAALQAGCLRSQEATGDPTEIALLVYANKSGINFENPKRIAAIPFDSEYKYMAVLLEGTNDNNVIYIKGAPERLLDFAETDRNQWESAVSQLSQQGQRVLAGAFKIVDKSQSEIKHEDLKNGVVFLGLAGIIDPPRDEAIEAIRLCKEAGISVKMITGDHIETAKAIGLELGIGNGENALQGKDLQNMNDTELQDAAEQNDVFARTSPHHKLKLVEALQARGHVCAMTGDGVNDAPALRKADVGVAMGIKGTDVTKDSAEIVLADDNFQTIVSAVEEGRRVYDNLKKAILFILPTNGALSLLVLTSILFGVDMLLTPLLILWVNMATSVTISMAFAFETLEIGAMQRKPRSPKSHLLSGYFIWRIIYVSLLIAGATLALDIALLRAGMPREAVMTITLQTIVFAQLFHLFNNRSVFDFALDKNFFSNKSVFIVALILIILQMLITYVPFLSSIFGTNPMRAIDWLYPIGIGAFVFVCVEIEKAFTKTMLYGSPA